MEGLYVTLYLSCTLVTQTMCLTFWFIVHSTSVKVTFWDDFAHMFADECKEEIVFPLILIIGSARVQLWQGIKLSYLHILIYFLHLIAALYYNTDEVVLSNVPATTIHINCNHCSVTEMRRM